MPEQTAIVAAELAADGGDAAAVGGRMSPRRRRYFTGDARRPFRVCRWPVPINGEDSDPAYCRCGGVLVRTAAARRGWRHQPTRPRAAIVPGPVR